MGLVLMLAACGDNASPCDHTELDDVADGAAPEVTHLTLGADGRTVCGNVDGGHYDSLTKIVDVDRYRVTFAGQDALAVELEPLDGADALSRLSVQIFDTAADPRLVADQAWDPAYDHGAFASELAPGDYAVVVTARAAGDIAGGTIGYRVHAAPVRCDPDAHASYTEADEAGNDALKVDEEDTPIVAAAAGTAEPTNLKLSLYGHYMVAGTATAGATVGNYVDSDTYAVTTDRDVDELTIRLDWTGIADLDTMVVDADTLAIAGLGVVTSTTSGELATFAVKPQTRYFVWVGAFMGSTGSTPYALTMCANQMVP
jgi:hypothetical protein